MLDGNTREDISLALREEVVTELANLKATRRIPKSGSFIQDDSSWHGIQEQFTAKTVRLKTSQKILNKVYACYGRAPE